jgi:hypothetical protein
MADSDRTEPPSLIDAIAADELKRIQGISEALFNAKHRLPMAVVIATAPEDALYAESLAMPAGTSETQAGSELRHFHAAGLLEQLPAGSWKGRRGRPPKRYSRRRAQKWELLRKLAEPDEE